MDTETIVDQRRSEFALCISIEEREGGGARLIFDDVKRDSSVPPRWQLFTFVTNVDTDVESLKAMRFSDEQFAEFGRTVLGALAVHLQRK